MQIRKKLEFYENHVFRQGYVSHHYKEVCREIFTLHEHRILPGWSPDGQLVEGDDLSAGLQENKHVFCKDHLRSGQTLPLFPKMVKRKRSMARCTYEGRCKAKGTRHEKNSNWLIALLNFSVIGFSFVVFCCVP